MPNLWYISEMGLKGLVGPVLLMGLMWLVGPCLAWDTTLSKLVEEVKPTPPPPPLVPPPPTPPPLLPPSPHQVKASHQQTFYQFLDLQPNCTTDDVRRAYKKLALVLHPDNNTAEVLRFFFLLSLHSFFSGCRKPVSSVGSHIRGDEGQGVA